MTRHLLAAAIALGAVSVPSAGQEIPGHPDKLSFEPIVFEGEAVGIPDLVVMIMAGETEDSIKVELALHVPGIREER